MPRAIPVPSAFCRSLFGAETGREAFRGIVCLAAAVGDLNRGEDPQKEAIAVARNGVADARDFHEIGTGTKNHKATGRYCFTVAPWDDESVRRQRVTPIDEV